MIDMLNSYNPHFPKILLLQVPNNIAENLRSFLSPFHIVHYLDTT